MLTPSDWPGAISRSVSGLLLSGLTIPLCSWFEGRCFVIAVIRVMMTPVTRMTAMSARRSVSPVGGCTALENSHQFPKPPAEQFQFVSGHPRARLDSQRPQTLIPSIDSSNSDAVPSHTGFSATSPRTTIASGTRFQHRLNCTQAIVGIGRLDPIDPTRHGPLQKISHPRQVSNLRMWKRAQAGDQHIEHGPEDFGYARSRIAYTSRIQSFGLKPDQA